MGCGDFVGTWFPFREFNVYYWGIPPPPLVFQNLENKRFILSLCARSLSLKELRAKSREHGSYGCQSGCPGSLLELGWRRGDGMEVALGSDCQGTAVILQIMYLTTGYLIWGGQSMGRGLGSGPRGSGRGVSSMGARRARARGRGRPRHTCRFS
jgi:hypothetical protein